MILKEELSKFSKGLLQTGAIPLLLTIVALRQITLAHGVGLSPWHGGGFGMFASLDRDERRLLTATLTCDNQSWPINLTTSPEVITTDAYTHLITVPTNPQLHKLGQRLLTQTQTGQLASPCHSSSNSSSNSSSTQLQVWRLTYDGKAITYAPITPNITIESDATNSNHGAGAQP